MMQLFIYDMTNKRFSLTRHCRDTKTLVTRTAAQENSFLLVLLKVAMCHQFIVYNWVSFNCQYFCNILFHNY